MTAASPANVAKLSVQNVSKTFRVVGEDKTFRLLPVLRNVSFDVFETEIVSLIGESGSGKTTMLRIVQGLIKADSGQIHVGDKPINGPGYDRGIVFQQANLLPWLNAQHNVEFGLELKGVPKTERESRARDLLQLVGLTEFARQYPHQLSGGMQQRIGVARALAIDPEILLMDEPFSALDAQTRESLQHELLSIHLKTRKTILFVTHDLDEAVYLSDRVIVMGSRPGHVKDVIEVPFPRPRPSLPEMRGDSRFLELRDHIWQRIRPPRYGERTMSGTPQTVIPAEELLETIGPDDAFTKRKWRYTIIRTCSIILAFTIWEIFGRQINPLFMSYPSKIFLGAISLIQAGVLQAALLESLRTLVLGYIGGALFGVLVGLAVGRYREVEAALDWIINAFYATPLVALIPLVILWFGLGFTAKLFIVFLFALFPVLINTSIGVKNVNRSLIDVGVAFVANERQIFTKIILPASLPYIMAGLRLGIGRAIIGMVTAEFFTAISGLGGLVVKYGNQFRTDQMLVPVIILMGLGVILTGSLQRAEQFIAPWKSNENNE